jgi:hypothetical protein
MKERLKKFWQEEKTRVYYYAGGFAAGLATGLAFYMDARAKEVEDVVLNVNEEEHRAQVTLVHKNGIESRRQYHKRVA